MILLKLKNMRTVLLPTVSLEQPIFHPADMDNNMDFTDISLGRPRCPPPDIQDDVDFDSIRLHTTIFEHPHMLLPEDVPDPVHCDINFDDISLYATHTTNRLADEHADGDADMHEVRINLPIIDRCDTNPSLVCYILLLYM